MGCEGCIEVRKGKAGYEERIKVGWEETDCG